MNLSRRGFLAGLVAVAAPAVIRTPGLLMPVRSAPIWGKEASAINIFALLREGLDKQFLEAMSLACEDAFIFGRGVVELVESPSLPLVNHVPWDQVPRVVASWRSI